MAGLKDRCEVCGAARSKSAIIDDYYYRHICDACHARLSTVRVSSGQAEYERSRDLEEHEADVLQPYSGGQPSAEFMRLYPDTAKKMFTDDEIDRATRA